MRADGGTLDICPWPPRGSGPSVEGVGRNFSAEVCVVLSNALLAASRSPALRRAVVRLPATRRVVDRFVAGETLDDVFGVIRTLTADGIAVTVDHLGEDVTDPAEARRSRDAYLALLEGLAPLGLGPRAEVSVKLSAF